MNVFYEEDGGFKVGHMMSDTGASLQVEAITGKRSKVKTASVLLRFESPPLADFLPEAEQHAAKIEPDFLWEVCGEEDFSFDDLARDYFGRMPTAPEAAAVAISLHAAPMYFYKRGKGKYKAAPEENLKAALASIERKKREAEQMAGWVAQLIGGNLPDEMRTHLGMLLYKPDRNTLLVKAAEEAVAKSGTPLSRLMFNAGAWPDRDSAAYQYHLGKFLAEYFPRGREYSGEMDACLPDAVPSELPLSNVAAFSIDDANTTEIDDAFSITTKPNGDWEIGIHIAAPALAFPFGGALDKLAASRLSTVYFPGEKITMLPDAAVAVSTLAEGRACPVVSMYATFAAADLSLLGTRSAIESVKIEKNLRIGELETYFHAESLQAGKVDGPYGEQLLLLHRIANTLAARRGKNQNEQDRVDYNFEITDDHRVIITNRKRGNPVDTVVSELMIFVNAEWGKLLADNGVSAIYRAQQNMKTRMTTEVLPHEGLGVAQYAWSSSPLRRCVDLVNQRQLIALLKNEAPPFGKRSPELKELAHRFDLSYEAYNEFQRNLERYWCLRYLEQEGISEFSATIIRDELVRATELPLIVKLHKNPELPAKTAVTVKVEEIDYWDIGGKFSLMIAEEKNLLEPQMSADKRG